MWSMKGSFLLKEFKIYRDSTPSIFCVETSSCSSQFLVQRIVYEISFCRQVNENLEKREVADPEASLAGLGGTSADARYAC